MPLAAPCVLHRRPGHAARGVGTFQTDAAGIMDDGVPHPGPPSHDPGPPPGRRDFDRPPVPSGSLSLTNGLDVWRPCPPCTYSRLDWATPRDHGLDRLRCPVDQPVPGGAWTSASSTRPTATRRPTGSAGRLTSPVSNALKSYARHTVVGLPMRASRRLRSIRPARPSGTPGRLTAVLRLNIAFNAAGCSSAPTMPGLGNMIYSNPAGPGRLALDGMTVNQILTVCRPRAGRHRPPGRPHVPDPLALLLEQLSIAFENCVPTAFGPATTSCSRSPRTRGARAPDEAARRRVHPAPLWPLVRHEGRTLRSRVPCAEFSLHFARSHAELLRSFDESR